MKLPINVVSPHPLLMLPLHTTNSARLPGVAGILQDHGMKWIINRNKFREGQSVSLQDIMLVMICKLMSYIREVLDCIPVSCLIATDWHI